MANAGPGVRPPTPTMFRTDPFASFRCGHAARINRTAPKYFRLNPSRKSSSVNDRKSPRLVAPALFTTTSSFLNRSRANATRRAGASGARRSSAIASASPPAAVICWTASPTPPGVRAHSTQDEPRAASVTARVRPMPRLAPVTIATFPFNVRTESSTISLATPCAGIV